MARRYTSIVLANMQGVNTAVPAPGQTTKVACYRGGRRRDGAQLPFPWNVQPKLFARLTESDGRGRPLTPQVDLTMWPCPSPRRSERCTKSLKG